LVDDLYDFFKRRWIRSNDRGSVPGGSWARHHSGRCGGWSGSAQGQTEVTVVVTLVGMELVRSATGVLRKNSIRWETSTAVLICAVYEILSLMFRGSRSCFLDLRRSYWRSDVRVSVASILVRPRCRESLPPQTTGDVCRAEAKTAPRNRFGSLHACAIDAVFRSHRRKADTRRTTPPVRIWKSSGVRMFIQSERVWFLRSTGFTLGSGSTNPEASNPKVAKKCKILKVTFSVMGGIDLSL